MTSFPSSISTSTPCSLNARPIRCPAPTSFSYHPTLILMVNASTHHPSHVLSPHSPPRPESMANTYTTSPSHPCLALPLLYQLARPCCLSTPAPMLILLTSRSSFLCIKVTFTALSLLYISSLTLHPSVHDQAYQILVSVSFYVCSCKYMTDTTSGLLAMPVVLLAHCFWNLRYVALYFISSTFSLLTKIL